MWYVPHGSSSGTLIYLLFVFGNTNSKASDMSFLCTKVQHYPSKESHNVRMRGGGWKEKLDLTAKVMLYYLRRRIQKTTGGEGK